MSKNKLFFVAVGLGVAYSTVVTKATAKALSAKATKAKRKEDKKKQQDDRIFDEATC